MFTNMTTMTMIMSSLLGVSRAGLQSTNFVQPLSPPFPPLSTLSEFDGGACRDDKEHDMRMGIIMGPQESQGFGARIVILVSSMSQVFFDVRKFQQTFILPPVGMLVCECV